jgi:ABC-type dipeptide/oligopeptide/nickel transport system ATPase component
LVGVSGAGKTVLLTDMLDALTPPLRRVTGGHPMARRRHRIRIAGRQIKIYVYNTQNATPDVQAHRRPISCTSLDSARPAA